jgi:hypothetical protein
MWTQIEKEQWKEIQDKLSKILGRDIQHDLVTHTLLEFIELYHEKVSK